MQKLRLLASILHKQFCGAHTPAVNLAHQCLWKNERGNWNKPTHQLWMERAQNFQENLTNEGLKIEPGGKRKLHP